MDINSDSGGVGSRGGRVNTLVPGHRKIYKEAGITKQQIKAGRTRYNQQTPVQEHQARADGTIIEPRKPPAEINLDKQCMKDLMDWMWRTRHEKFADSPSDDKLWAPAGIIPRQMRPKMSQLVQFDWALQNPYPGWILAIDQGSAGWKCKLMTDEEFCLFGTGVGRSKNPKSINRTLAAGPRDKQFYSHSKNAEAEIAKRKCRDPSSSSDEGHSGESSGKESAVHGSTNCRRDSEAEFVEKRKCREPSSTSVYSEDSPGDDSAGHDSTIHTKCMTELGVPRDDVNKVMLSLYEEI